MTLGALARETSSIRLGTLVTSATFRHPAAGRVGGAGRRDERGRVEIGIGTGWFEREHQAYGIPFRRRRAFRRLTEQLEIVTGLWNTPPGRHSTTPELITHCVTVRRCPSPCSARIRRSSSAARRQAHAGAGRNLRRRVQRAVRKAGHRAGPVPAGADAVDSVGRSPDSMTYSAAFVLCAGRDDAELARAAAIGRELAEMRSNSRWWARRGNCRAPWSVRRRRCAAGVPATAGPG
ncbi:luciferase-like monooxygenase family protein [Mycobacterium xenopi 3993]|nr:luciferase-like monooxygenase family protein [Mycobacterium xenopi 3993]